MIEIRKANETNAELLAHLGEVTYTESHGHFFEDKNDLPNYIRTAFSVSKAQEELDDANNLIYIMYSDDLPIGYAKLVLNALQENLTSQNICKLERIYILNDFIPLKVGQQLLNFLETKARELQLDTMWLTVYIKNIRAIRFYQKNKFKDVGTMNFMVNGKGYENTIFSKAL